MMSLRIGIDGIGEGENDEILLHLSLTVKTIPCLDHCSRDCDPRIARGADSRVDDIWRSPMESIDATFALLLCIGWPVLRDLLFIGRASLPNEKTGWLSTLLSN